MSLYEEKAFDKKKIQHPFMIKSVSKVSIEGTNLNTIKVIYNKLACSILWNGENLETVPLICRCREGCPLSPPPFNTFLEILARATRQEKEVKELSIGKEKVKSHLLADDMLYIKRSRRLH